MSAEDFGVHGKIYTILEPDALSEIEAKAQAVDWAKVISKEALTKKIIAYKPKDIKKLPTAKENKTRRVEMTYMLPSDIKDSNNTVVYPQGYQFNPLDYVALPFVLVFIDATDPKQIQWYQSSPYESNSNTILMITDGSYYDLTHKLKQTVYYASSEMIERFKLSAVPSIVRQAGRTVEVVEERPKES